MKTVYASTLKQKNTSQPNKEKMSIDLKIKILKNTKTISPQI
jgi:hypothetical protein